VAGGQLDFNRSARFFLIRGILASNMFFDNPII